MKQREGPDQRGVGFEKLPYEALRAVPADGEIESLVDPEAVAVQNTPRIDQRERRHRSAFVKLHRMAQHAIAEIVRPGDPCWRAVGEVVQTREEAADAADRDADRKWQREARPGSQGDARDPLVDFDRNDRAGDRTL